MFEFVNNKPGVLARVLFEELKLCTYGQYHKWCQRGKLQKLRNACPGKPALVRFDILPSEFKDAILEKFGNPYDLNKYYLEEDLQPDPEAKTFFDTYRYEGGGLSQLQKERYVLQAEILNAIRRIYKTKRETQIILDGKAKDADMWKHIAILVGELDPERFDHKMPLNHRRLKAKYIDYKEEGYIALVHGGMGNENRSKITPAIGDWITAIYCLPNKLTPTMVLAKYNQTREEKEWPELSESAIIHYLNKPEVKRIWTAARHGKDEWTKQFGYHTKRDKSKLFPNAYWVIDGTKLDWIHFEDNSLGMAAKLKINPIIDVFSEKILGWSYSTTEDHTDHFSALKMATNAAGVRPYFLSYDNQGGHKSKRMQELYTNVVAKSGGTHYPHKAYSKANPIEQMFNRLQQQVLNRQWYSDGQSIKVRNVNNAPNMDFIKENKHHLNSIERLFKQWELCVQLWNAAKHPHFELSRNEVYGMEATRSEELTPLEQAQIFWVEETKPITYRRGGIQLKISKKKYDFEVYTADGSIDVDFRTYNIGAKFIVRYDPEALDSYVQLLKVEPDGSIGATYMAQPKRAHQFVPALMEEGDKAAWSQDYKVVDQEYQRDLTAYQQIAARTGITPESLIEEQELILKMNGKVPKPDRSEAEANSLLNQI